VERHGAPWVAIKNYAGLAGGEREDHPDPRHPTTLLEVSLPRLRVPGEAQVPATI
jgi:hypothetical protein